MVGNPPEMKIIQNRWSLWRIIPAVVIAISIFCFSVVIATEYDRWKNPMGDGDCWVDDADILFTSSSLKNTSVELVIKNKEVSNRLGSIISAKSMSAFGPSGRVWELASFGQAEWRYRIHGSKADAWVQVKASKVFGKWSITKQIIQIDTQDFVLFQ